MKTIDLVYFDAGGGHRAAARALQQAIAAQGRPWQVRLVQLADVLDPGRRWRTRTGIDPEAFYNARLAHGRTLGIAHGLRVLQALIRLAHRPMRQALEQHWLRSEPDLVVSLVPNFNRVLCESLARTLPGVPYVTAMTDMADLPPRFWIERGQRQHLVCGTTEAVAQARRAGHADSHLWLTSGMVIDPSFYRPLAVDRARELAALGLDPARPTGLVLFGAQGSMQMLSIARRLDAHQLLLMCGRHTRLADMLRALPRSAPHAVVGFTPEVARHMALADYFIGKPGPASLAEALHMGLPAITFLNAWTMPQERWNAGWIAAQRLGRVVRSAAALPAAVDDVLANLPALRRRVAAIDNRAVFELPQILADILATEARPARGLPAIPALEALR